MKDTSDMILEAITKVVEYTSKDDPQANLHVEEFYRFGDDDPSLPHCLADVEYRAGWTDYRLLVIWAHDGEEGGSTVLYATYIDKASDQEVAGDWELSQVEVLYDSYWSTIYTQTPGNSGTEVSNVRPVANGGFGTGPGAVCS